MNAIPVLGLTVLIAVSIYGSTGYNIPNKRHAFSTERSPAFEQHQHRPFNDHVYVQGNDVGYHNGGYAIHSNTPVGASLNNGIDPIIVNNTIDYSRSLTTANKNNGVGPMIDTAVNYTQASTTRNLIDVMYPSYTVLNHSEILTTDQNTTDPTPSSLLPNELQPSIAIENTFTSHLGEQSVTYANVRDNDSRSVIKEKTSVAYRDAVNFDVSNSTGQYSAQPIGDSRMDARYSRLLPMTTTYYSYDSNTTDNLGRGLNTRRKSLEQNRTSSNMSYDIWISNPTNISTRVPSRKTPPFWLPLSGYRGEVPPRRRNRPRNPLAQRVFNRAKMMARSFAQIGRSHTSRIAAMSAGMRMDPKGQKLNVNGSSYAGTHGSNTTVPATYFGRDMTHQAIEKQFNLTRSDLQNASTFHDETQGRERIVPGLHKPEPPLALASTEARSRSSKIALKSLQLSDMCSSISASQCKPRIRQKYKFENFRYFNGDDDKCFYDDDDDYLDDDDDDDDICDEYRDDMLDDYEDDRYDDRYEDLFDDFYYDDFGDYLDDTFDEFVDDKYDLYMSLRIRRRQMQEGRRRNHDLLIK